MRKIFVILSLFCCFAFLFLTISGCGKSTSELFGSGTVSNLQTQSSDVKNPKGLVSDDVNVLFFDGSVR